VQLRVHAVEHASGHEKLHAFRGGRGRR
jgi:hypothetical protein